MEDQFDVPAKSSKVSDNLTSSDSYYWFNGKQEPLHKIPEYSFVIAEEASTENLNAFVTRSGRCPKEMKYNRYSVPKKAFRLSNESRTVWSKIPTKILSENRPGHSAANDLSINSLQIGEISHIFAFDVTGLPDST